MNEYLISFKTPISTIREYYKAYAENASDVEEYIYANCFDEIVDSFMYDYWDEWEKLYIDEDEKLDEDPAEMILSNLLSDCYFEISETTDADDYAPDGCELEILYDERN